MTVELNGKQLLGLDNALVSLRSAWEETSFELEKLQCNEKCALEEQEVLKTYIGPTYSRTAPYGGPKMSLPGKSFRIF